MSNNTKITDLSIEVSLAKYLLRSNLITQQEFQKLVILLEKSPQKQICMV